LKRYVEPTTEYIVTSADQICEKEKMADNTLTKHFLTKNHSRSSSGKKASNRRFEVFKAVMVQIMVFWDLSPRSPVHGE
jgi:hypothetical protein